MSSDIKRLRPGTRGSAIASGPGPLERVAIISSVDGSERSTDSDQNRKREPDKKDRGPTKDIVTLSKAARSIEQESIEPEEDGPREHQDLGSYGPGRRYEPEFEHRLNRVIGADPTD
jgi:hypothetical protein